MTTDRWIILATIALSFRAGVTNLLAYHKGFNGGFIQFKSICLTRGLLAMVYTTSFVWLFFNTERRLDWSRVMLGVGLVVWYQVWMLLKPISRGLIGLFA